MFVLWIELLLGRIAKAWTLMWLGLAALKSYKAMLFLPVTSAAFAFLVSVIVVGGGILAFDLPIQNPTFQEEVPRATMEAARQILEGRRHYAYELRHRPTQAVRTPEKLQYVWLCIFALYLANYSVIVFFNVALAAVALDRLAGGHSTLDDGFRVAWSRMGKILQWALLAGTIGFALRMLRKDGRIGAWFAGFLGYAWSFGSFFVIPMLAADDINPGGALFQSATLIKNKWGEAVSAGFSFRLLYFVLALPGLLLLFAGSSWGWPNKLGALGVFPVLAYWVLLAIVMSAAQQVVVAALYRYACTAQVAGGFSRAEFRRAWKAPL
jgi:hypothetical protein